MTDVGSEYVLLRENLRRARENQLNTRPLDIRTPSGEPIMIGLDADMRKHLLLPLSPDEKLVADTKSQGVWLTELPLIVEGRQKRFADLHCRDEDLDLVFERLVEDVAHRVKEQQPIATACHVALDQWRAMLRTGKHLSRGEILGLIGELEVLRRLGKSSPVAALDAWLGPRRTIHDFVHEGRAIEVKATSSVEGNTVSINGLDQLDPSDVSELHLVVVHMAEAGTAPSLDDRIRDLLRAGYPRGRLLEGVERVGYVFERDPDSHDTRFRIKSLRVWHVGDDFPGLRRSGLPIASMRGVSRVTYELSVDSAPRPLDSEKTETFLASWLGQNG
jgi:hypothetical protein